MLRMLQRGIKVPCVYNQSAPSSRLRLRQVHAREPSFDQAKGEYYRSPMTLYSIT